MKDIIILLLFTFTVSIKKIDSNHLKDILKQQKIYVIDTRNVTDSEKGYIPNSIILPLTLSYDNWLPKIVPKNAAIILITYKNGQKNAIQLTHKLGYLSIFGYAYYDDWVNSKFEVKKVLNEEITFENIENIKQKGEIILDVREEKEYIETGIIKDSQLVSLSEFKNKLKKIESVKTVHILCKTGKRAEIAYTYLEKFGFKNTLKVLEGGITKVIQIKYPLEKYKKK